MPSQHIDLSLLSAAAVAAAATKRDTIHHFTGYRTNLRRHQKTSQSFGSANCSATTYRCGSHRHSRERVILRNYCSGSPRQNACPTGPAQSIGGDAIEKEATATTTTVGGRGEGYRDVASDFVYMRSTCKDIDRHIILGRQTDRQRQRQSSEHINRDEHFEIRAPIFMRFYLF